MKDAWLGRPQGVVPEKWFPRGRPGGEHHFPEEREV